MRGLVAIVGTLIIGSTIVGMHAYQNSWLQDHPPINIRDAKILKVVPPHRSDGGFSDFNYDVLTDKFPELVGFSSEQWNKSNKLGDSISFVLKSDVNLVGVPNYEGVRPDSSYKGSNL